MTVAHSWHFRSALFITLCIGCFVSPVFAQTPSDNRADATYAFALTLYEKSDFSRAITEFKRYEFEAGGRDHASLTTAYAIATSYQHAHDWVRARDAWLMLILRFPDAPVTQEAGYRICECYMGAGDYTSAREALERYQKNADPKSVFLDDAAFLRGLSLLPAHDWTGAQAQFTAVTTNIPDSTLIPAATLLAERAEAISALPKKSSHVAVLLSSIVPGMGQAYAGRRRDGAAAFLVNAAFFALAANRFHENDTTGGTLLALMSTTFYLGNIYGAGGAATTTNRSQEEKAVTQALEQAAPLLGAKLGHQEQFKPWPALP